MQTPIPVINLHPALPGAFDGAHAIERAYQAFQNREIKCSGAMVHRVVREVDRGAPVIVQEVEIKEDEPLEAFEERLHKVEWVIIVKATAKVLDEILPLQVSHLCNYLENLISDILFPDRDHNRIIRRNTGSVVQLAQMMYNAENYL